MHGPVTALAIAAALLVQPVSAGLACMMGNANDALQRLMASAGERPILKMEVATSATDGMPTILIANPDGNWSMIMLMPNGTACILGVGRRLQRANADLVFPVERAQ